MQEGQEPKLEKALKGENNLPDRVDSIVITAPNFNPKQEPIRFIIKQKQDK